MVICLEQGADWRMAQLMPLPLTGITFLVPAHLGRPGKRAVKRVCVCACVRACVRVCEVICTLAAVKFNKVLFAVGFSCH